MKMELTEKEYRLYREVYKDVGQAAARALSAFLLGSFSQIVRAPTSFDTLAELLGVSSDEVAYIHTCAKQHRVTIPGSELAFSLAVPCARERANA